MKAIVMGCGQVGERVARLLVREGHEVVVVDSSQEALERLGKDFRGRALRGVGFDRAVLLEAGIDQAEAFAATTSSDSANIVAARIARNVFHVPRVVARVHDQRRAELCRRLGLVTISPPVWGAGRIFHLLTHREIDIESSFGGGQVVLVSFAVEPSLAGRLVKDLTVPGEGVVVALVRQGASHLPTLGTELRDGDLVYMSLQASAMPRLEGMLGLGEGG
jgi:trk system potassium uptake protein TrkA